jgi:hypothetical protein
VDGQGRVESSVSQKRFEKARNVHKNLCTADGHELPGSSRFIWISIWIFIWIFIWIIWMPSGKNV